MVIHHLFIVIILQMKYLYYGNADSRYPDYICVYSFDTLFRVALIQYLMVALVFLFSQCLLQHLMIVQNTVYLNKILQVQQHHIMVHDINVNIQIFVVIIQIVHKVVN